MFPPSQTLGTLRDPNLHKRGEEDTLEQAVDAAIALCDGDVRAALRAALVYNEFLERKLGQFRIKRARELPEVGAPHTRK
jgi:hypothetical protein